MKYIRTKDELYENNGLLQCNSTAEENAIIVCGGHFAIPMSKIIKQADTIEELCDEFVIVDKLGNKPVIDNCVSVKNLKSNLEVLENVDIYCAIWTDKGLIYVAKINDKGKLCLL